MRAMGLLARRVRRATGQHEPQRLEEVRGAQVDLVVAHSPPRPLVESSVVTRKEEAVARLCAERTPATAATAQAA